MAKYYTHRLGDALVMEAQPSHHDCQVNLLKYHNVLENKRTMNPHTALTMFAFSQNVTKSAKE